MLSKFEGSLKKYINVLKNIVNIWQTLKKVIILLTFFKNQEFRVIEITKTVENFLEECKEFDTLYEINFEKPFHRDFYQNQ